MLTRDDLKALHNSLVDGVAERNNLLALHHTKFSWKPRHKALAAWEAPILLLLSREDVPIRCYSSFHILDICPINSDLHHPNMTPEQTKLIDIWSEKLARLRRIIAESDQ